MMCGKSVIDKKDPMKKVELERLVKSIKTPKPEIESLINTLRLVYDMDIKRYSEQKKRLPFFVCATFNPPFRRKENFVSTQYFILDLDKLHSKEIVLEDLRTRICKDSRVKVCFASPSLDGLKILFQLKEKCFDAGIYSLFYQKFVKEFAKQYNIEQVVDSVTSDVSRACFISVDANCYYNPNAEAVDLKNYVNEENTFELFDLKHQQDKQIEQQNKDVAKQKGPNEPEDAVMKKIKEHLFKKEATRQQNKEDNAIIPQRLAEIVEPLSLFLQDFGVAIVGIKNISYGKQFHLRVGLKEAQINVYCSLRGVFNIVPTTLRGTDGEFTNQMKELIDSFFAENL